MQWVDSLYSSMRQLWEKKGKPSSGYDIFYSPVIMNPEVLIIGYNPGGDSSSFTVIPEKPPAEHGYLNGEYDMAKKMRQLFASAGISQKLDKSVKINLFFFRTRNAAEVRKLDDESKSFCLTQTKQVIDTILPKAILVEGFETFEQLAHLLKIKQEKEVKFLDSALMLFSNYNGIPILGIPHPTGAWKFTGEHWDEVARLLKIELVV